MSRQKNLKSFSKMIKRMFTKEVGIKLRNLKKIYPKMECKLSCHHLAKGLQVILRSSKPKIIIAFKKI